MEASYKMECDEGSTMQVDDKDEMEEVHERAQEACSPEQTDMEEVLTNTEASVSQRDVEILGNTAMHSSSSWPEQLDKKETLENVDGSGGSPAENKEENLVKALPHYNPKQGEFHGSVDRSSFLVGMKEFSNRESVEASRIAMRYRKPLSQEDASVDFKMLNTVKRLDVNSTSIDVLQKHSEEHEITVATEGTDGSAGLASGGHSKEVDMECMGGVGIQERSLKTVQEMVDSQSPSHSGQHASDIIGGKRMPGADIFQESRQTVGKDHLSDAVESSSGKVREQVVGESISENRQDLDTAAVDGVEKTRGVATDMILKKKDGDYSDSPSTELPTLEYKKDDTDNYDSKNVNTFKMELEREFPLLSNQKDGLCDNEGTLLDMHEEKDSMYKCENSGSLLKGKKKYRKRPCTMEKGIQTAIELQDSSEFRDCSLDFATVQVEVGFMSADDLECIDLSLDDWPVVLVSQLRLRDSVINTLKIKLLDILSKGCRLEEDVDYLKLKILDLKQQVKEKSPSKKEQCSQTTDEDITSTSTSTNASASAWWKWYSEAWNQYYSEGDYSGMWNQYYGESDYCGSWNHYYGESDPYSTYYWPSHYSQDTTVSSSTQLRPTQPNEESSIGVDKTVPTGNETQDIVEQTVEKQGNNGQMSEDTQICPHINAESNAQEQSLNSKADVNELSQQRIKRNLNQHELCKSQKDIELYDEGQREIVQDYREQETNTSSNIEISDEITGKEITKSYQVERLNENYSYRPELENSREENQNISDESYIVDVDSRWDASGVNIAAQVEAVAAEAVQNTGYVYQEELGLYYDYYSGYYYDAENGLYYDSSTGIYFFYDHASQAYQFHSQVSTREEKKRRHVKDEDEKGIQQEKKKRSAVDREEGEYSDSNEEEQDKNESVVDNEEEETDSESDEEAENEEVSAHIPPSLRLMVVESESDQIKVGSLHLVTLDGGTVGRDAGNVVRLVDLSISKVHAEITYHSDGLEDHHYFIKDLRSNNGTFVNGVRISEPREPSQEVEIGHGWLLQFGSIKIKCHMHQGRLTCNECEPGLVLSSHATCMKSGKYAGSFKDAKSREKARKKQLKAMRKKYAVSPRNEIPVVGVEYNDRALKRLKEVGSDNPYEKTEVASTDVALRENNKGYTLLQKMGWSEGQGLGKSETGITEPIQPESAVGFEGLGSTHLIALPSEPPKDTRRKHLQITKERYKQTTNN